MSSEAAKPSGRRSLGFLVTGTVFAQGIQLAASLFLTRLYTPDEFGQYASIIAIASVLGAVSTLSYPRAIPLAQDDEESRDVAWLALAASGIAASIITVAMSAGVIWGVEAWGWRPGWQHVVFVPLTALAIAMWGTLQVRQSRLSAFDRVAFATGSGATSQVGTQLALGWSAAGAVGLSTGYLVGRLVNVAVLLRGVHLGRPPGLRVLRRVAARWSQIPRWLLPATVMNLLGTSALTPWVALQFGLDTAGSFAFAFQMLSVPAALVGQAVATILFPRLAEAERGPGISPVAVEGYVRRLTSVALPVFLPVLVLGPELFSVVFGSEWTQAGQVAAILSPYLAVNLVSSPISSIPVVKLRLGRILIWATLDTAARFTAIALGGIAGSSVTGFALYSVVGTVSMGGFLAWSLRLSGVRPAALISSSWGAISLAVGSVLILVLARSRTSAEVLILLTCAITAAAGLMAIRGLRH